MRPSLTAQRAHAPQRAESFAREAQRIAHRVGHAATAALATTVLGRVALQRGDTERARDLLVSALRSYESSHDAVGAPDVMESLAAVALARGDARAAARLLGTAAARRERDSILVVAAERADYDRLVANVKAALAPGLYDAEFTIGEHALTDPN